MKKPGDFTGLQLLYLARYRFLYGEFDDLYFFLIDFVAFHILLVRMKFLVSGIICIFEVDTIF
jgi:hypothetical protein